MSKIIKLGIIISAVALLAAGCNSAKTNTNTNSNTQSTFGGQSQTVSTDSQAKTFTVKGQNFSFSPSEIRVKKGDKVKIVFQNTGGFHDWVVDEFNARTGRIKDNETATVEFTADKTGTFEYYCSVGEHRQMGMKGNLIVE